MQALWQQVQNMLSNMLRLIYQELLTLQVQSHSYRTQLVMEKGYCRCTLHDIGQPEGGGECGDVRAVVCVQAGVRVWMRVDSFHVDLHNNVQPVCPCVQCEATLVECFHVMLLPSSPPPPPPRLRGKCLSCHLSDTEIKSHISFIDHRGNAGVANYRYNPHHTSVNLMYLT